MTALRQLTGYWAWLAWTLGEGAFLGHRPFDPAVRPNVPRLIPRPWWERRADFLAARKTAVPRPVPVPPPPPPDVWSGRGLFQTDMRAGDLSPVTLAARAWRERFSYVACQFTDSNDARLRLLSASLRDRGVRFVIWDAYPTPYRARRAASFFPSGYIAQCEGADVDWAGVGAETSAHGLPCAVVTNFSNLDPQLAAAGWACMPECYLSDNQNARVGGMVDEARRRGFKRVIPALGCYGGKTLADYGPPPEYIVWTAETLWFG